MRCQKVIKWSILLKLVFLFEVNSTHSLTLLLCWSRLCAVFLVELIRYQYGSSILLLWIPILNLMWSFNTSFNQFQSQRQANHKTESISKTSKTQDWINSKDKHTQIWWPIITVIITGGQVAGPNTGGHQDFWQNVMKMGAAGVARAKNHLAGKIFEERSDHLILINKSNKS